MDTRFNSFYREDLHPFVEAMQVRSYHIKPITGANLLT
jgi:hypothetical protein